MIRYFSLLILAFAFAVPCQAQTGAIASYALQVYQPGVNPATGNPFQTNPIPASAVNCNQTHVVPPAGTVMGPRTASWDDPTNVGKDCTVDQSTFLLALPIPSPSGAYLATVTATNDFALTSGRSAASNPFSPPIPPAVTTGLKVLR